MVEWMQSQSTAFWWLATSSAVIFVVTMIAMPVLAVRIPPDYFVGAKRRKGPGANLSPALRPILKIGKNVVGAILTIVGVVMLILPGPGVFVILLGVMLLNFPGKRRLVHWIVSRPSVFQSINKLRRRYGQRPLVIDA